MQYLWVEGGDLSELILYVCRSGNQAARQAARRGRTGLRPLSGLATFLQVE